MAAITAALLGLMRAGDHVVASKALFGSCLYVVEDYLPRYGVTSTIVDGFDLDQPGKDSHEHRPAGATEVLIGSSARFALMHELRGAPEPSLAELLARLAPVDLVLIEGFKRDRHPKLEVYRAAVGKPPLWLEDDAVVAVASDGPLVDCRCAVLDLDDISGIADLVVARAVDRAGLLG